jgi:hypothetical protein
MSIILPDLSTEAGLLARVFIAENFTPFDHAHYDEAQAMTCMKAQRAVLQNRLSHLDLDPVKFGAADATNLSDIVLGTNPQAVAGFSRGAPGVVISSGVQQRIDDVMTQANAGAPGKFTRFLQNAIASAQTPASDPFASITVINGVNVNSGAYFWRTEGSGSPGGNALLIPGNLGGLIAHNRFYAIKK